MYYSVTEAAHITGYSGARIRHYAIRGEIDARRRINGWEISEDGISQLFLLQAITTEQKRTYYPLYLQKGVLSW